MGSLKSASAIVGRVTRAGLSSYARVEGRCRNCGGVPVGASSLRPGEVLQQNCWFAFPSRRTKICWM